jgi:hypothetical protein
VRIPIHLNFETEPDEYIAALPPPGITYPVTGIRHMYAYLANHRPEMAAQTHAPARFNWMWRLDSEFELKCGSLADLTAQHHDLIADSLNQGDEMGAHFHPLRWNEAAGKWELPYDDRPWLEAELLNGLKKFETVLGFKPEAIRLSDNILITEDMLDLLERSGIKRDLTIEPDIVGTHLKWENVPQEATFNGFPRYPYQPERGNFRQPGELNRRAIWMLLTSTNYATKAAPGPTPEIIREYVALDLAFHPPTFAEIMNRQLESLENPYLLIVGNTNIGVSPRYRAFFEANFDFIMNHPLASLFQYVNSAGLVEWAKTQAVAQPGSDPLFEAWLRQRALQHKQEFETLEQTYRKLEVYTRSLEEHLAEKQDYFDTLAQTRPSGTGSIGRVNHFTSALKTKLKSKMPGGVK